LVFRHLASPHSSDDVAVQVAVDSWLRGLHHITYLPSDNYLFKLPVYLAAEILPVSAHLRLLLTVLVLNLGSFALFAVALKWFTSKAGRWDAAAVFLPTLWLSLIGGPFGVNMLVANYRNIELGTAFFILALVNGYASGALHWRRWQLTTAGIGLSFFWFNDPYFLLLMCAPLIVMMWAWCLLRQRDPRLLRASVWLGATALLSFIWKPIVGWLGIHVSGSASVTLHRLGARLALLKPSLATLLAVHFQTSPARVLLSLITLAVLVLGLFASCYLVWLGWRHRRFFDCFIGTQWLVVAAGFMLSSYIYDVGAGRYLVLIPFYFALAIALMLARMPPSGRRTAVIALLAVAAVANLLGDIRELTTGRLYPGTATQNQLLNDLSATGPAKGYAQYWSANINTYLTKGHPDVVPIDCTAGRIMPLLWFTDDANLRQSAARSFYLYEDNVPQAAACPPSALDQEFGTPVRIVRAGAHARLYLYNYDIRSRFVSPLP
jgi:hypothetical protein